jgi:hypothetical protein
MRSISPSFVVAPPTGATVRTRLRLSAADEAVLLQVGEYLGGLAGQDLAVRCRLGRGQDAWTDRKRALTTSCSSRWAGAITRTANDQWDRGYKNLLDERASLLDFPPGGGHRDYAAVVEGSGLMVACWCSHSMGGR